MLENGGAGKKFLWLLILSAGLFLVGNASVQLWDRDEPRYAECSREMLYGSPEHPGSDFVVPRFLGGPRYAKPPFIYWLQAVSMKVFGDTAFAARFPSTVAMLAVLVIVFCVVRKAVDDEHAIWTTFILATSALTFAAAKSSLTDAVLLVFITIAQVCAFAIWRGNFSWPLAIVFGVAVGLAGLTKGPVVLAMVAATLATLAVLRGIDWWIAKREATRGFLPLPPGEGWGEGEIRSAPVGETKTLDYRPNPLPEGEGTRRSAAVLVVKFLVATLLVVAIVSPWVYLIGQRHPGFLDTSWSTNVVDRIKKGSEGHSGPPGYYLVTIWGTYFPWSIFIPMAVVYAWKRRSDPHIRFALAAVIGPYVMLECVQTKLPHYLLPAFPFVAFLTADVLVRCFRREYDDLVRKSFPGIMRGWAVVVALLGSTPWLLAMKFRPQPWWALVVVSIVSIAYGVIVYRFFRDRRLRAGAATMGFGMAAFLVVVFTVFLPRAPYLRLSIKVADLLKQVGATQPGQVVMQDYKEPSLAFYQGGTIREWSDGSIDPDKVPTWLVTTRDVFNTTPDDVKAKFQVVGSIRGLAIADRMRDVEVMVLKKKTGN